MSKNLVALVKIGVAATLVFFLISSGKLDITQMEVFIKTPSVLWLSILIWFFLAVGCSSTRWYFLMLGLGLSPKYMRTIHLSVVGMFFNTVMPGAVGGDLIKGTYLFRSQQKKHKGAAVLSVFMDRLMGMFGLFTIAAVGVLANWRLILDSPQVQIPAVFCLSIFTLMASFLSLVLFRVAAIDSLIDRLGNVRIVGFGLLRKTYDSLKEYRTSRQYLLGSWILSVVIQGGTLAFYWYLTPIITGSEIQFSVIAAIIPVGMLLTAIPLAPGGLGVGHVAFDSLYALIGVEGGANIFNVFFLGQMSLNLLGLVPYLLLKSETTTAP